jgi:hypothetical protein
VSAPVDRAAAGLRPGHEHLSGAVATRFGISRFALDSLAPVAAGVLALALYAATRAPSLTWAHDGADGGDLLAAALARGVPHPTGYPTYQILLAAAIALLPGDPAAAGNWLSALAAAFAVGFLADLARRALPVTPYRGLVSLAAGLAWAASPALWSQAVITEVYTLNVLAVVMVLWLLWRWAEAETQGRPGYRWLALSCLAFGLGLGNHLSLGLILPAAAAWLWSHRRFLDGVSRGRAAVLPVLVILGLGTYTRLPVAAAGSPPVNWGDPQTLGGFWWVVSGGPYRSLFGGLTWADLIARLSSWVAAALEQLGGGPWGALLALAGLWWLDRNRHAWWRATGLVALAFTVYGLVYRTDTSFVYLIPAWGMAALWLAAGLAWGASAAAARWPSQRFAWGLALAALVILALAPVARFYTLNDLSRDRAARDFLAASLASAKDDAIILTSSDGPTFALWYGVYGLRARPDVTPINVNLYDYAWYRAALAAWRPELFKGQPADTSLAALLAAASSRFPVYRAEQLPVALPLVDGEQAGPLVKLRVP